MSNIFEILCNAPSFLEALLQRNFTWFSKFRLLSICVCNVVSSLLASRSFQENPLTNIFQGTGSDIFPGLKSCIFHKTFLIVSGLDISFVCLFLG